MMHSLFARQIQKKGFTLLEVLVAMAITGVVAVVLYSILGGMILNWRKAEDSMNASFNHTNLGILLSAKLENFYNFKSTVDHEAFFNGKENECRFISYYSALFPYFPVTNDLFLNEDNALVLKETPFFFDRESASVPDPLEMILGEDIDSFKAEYLIVDKTGGEPEGEWVTEFVKEVPEVYTLSEIKFTVTFTNGQTIVATGTIPEETGGTSGRPRF